MKRSDKLKPVRRYSDAKQQDAAVVLGKHTRALEDNQSRLRDLEQYREEYSQRFIARSLKGVSAAEWRDHHAFMDKLDEAIAQQKASISQLEKNREQAKRQWLAARGKAKAMEIVVDQYRKIEEVKQEKHLQREIDDQSAAKITKRNRE